MSIVRIIVADDDPHIRDLVSDVLEEAGYQVEAYGDGLTALNAVRTHVPAIALLDIAMPVMTGDVALHHIRAEGLPVPVVVMTADTHPERFLHMGASALLPKPFDLTELLRVIAEAQIGSGTPREVALGDAQVRRPYASG